MAGTKPLLRGASIYVQALDGDTLTTSAGVFRLGPVQATHVGKHEGPKVGDTLLVTNDPSPGEDALILVRIHNGCGCSFGLYRLRAG